MPAIVSFGDKEMLAAVRTVLLGLVPDGVEVIRAQVNRVAEPIGPDFCVLTPLRRERLSTNRDTDIDLKVIGSITDETMKVTSGPPLLAGYPLYGPGVLPGSRVTAALSTPGEYTVAPSQSVPGGTAIYAGRHVMLVATDVVLQCDVHGPNSDRNATAIATTWRDDAGCQVLSLAAASIEMQPLYADDPRQVPFINAESQWEDRWIVDLHMQANITVSLGQDFADELVINLFAVDLEIPA